MRVEKKFVLGKFVYIRRRATRHLVSGCFSSTLTAYVITDRARLLILCSFGARGRGRDVGKGERKEKE